MQITELDALTMFCGFTERVFSRSDLSDWVDVRVAKEAPRVSSELLELAFLSKLTGLEIEDVLRRIVGFPPEESRLRLAFIAARIRCGQLHVLDALFPMRRLMSLGGDEDEAERIGWAISDLRDPDWDMRDGVDGADAIVAAAVEKIFSDFVPVDLLERAIAIVRGTSHT